MCRLPDRVVNAEVKDLKERAAQYINKALQYACGSWHKHVVEVTTTRTPGIAPALRKFLEEKFIFWLEVLSVLGSAREAVDALETSARWAAVRCASLQVQSRRLTRTESRRRQPSISSMTTLAL